MVRASVGHGVPGQRRMGAAAERRFPAGLRPCAAGPPPRVVRATPVLRTHGQDPRRTGRAGTTGLAEDPLFPLPANDQQRDVVRRLGEDSGVVVEGPPGTGKTYTIA